MDAPDVIARSLAFVAVPLAFFLSAAAGLGGSLVLVPSLALLLGTKEGIVLAAVLLAANNVVKVIAYRQVLPFARSGGVIAVTVAGAFLGARLLVRAPEGIVTIAVIASLLVAFLSERRVAGRPSTKFAPIYAFASGATSGFSGTSGPLKGVAVKSLRLDRLHTVGAASLVSLFGDMTKTTVFAEAGLLGASSLWVASGAIPLMVIATLAGRRFTTSIGERGYERLFWIVMASYSARLLLGA